MQRTKNDPLVAKGKQIYESRLKAVLEPEHNGEFVVIEPDSGDYYLGDTWSAASEKALTEHPHSRFFLAKVGHRAAVSFRHRTSL